MTSTSSQVLSGEIAQSAENLYLMDSTFHKEPKILVFFWQALIFRDNFMTVIKSSYS